VFTLDFGEQGTYVVFARPDAIRDIFTAPSSTLHVGPGNAVLEPIVGRHSLLLLEHDAHVQERRLLMPAFQQKAVLGFAQVIRDAVQEATCTWAAGHEFVAHSFLQGVSSDIIVKAVFGLRPGPKCAELKTEILSLLNDKHITLGVLGRLRAGDVDPALSSIQERIARLRAVTRELVAERRATANLSDRDILSVLLTPAEGAIRSDESVVDELLTLVVTGHDTTTTALAWALTWICGHPGVEDEMRKELRDVDEADVRAISQLPYLDATCKEVLRIHPIVPAVFRQVMKPYSLCGYEFSPGTVLSPNIYLVHHRAELFPESDKFEPRRHLTRTYSPYEYLPFGGGARRCIGMHLALLEMKIILISLFRRFELRLAPGQQPTPVRRLVAVAPSTGPRVVVERLRA
jgi:cytochrome P450